MVHRILLYTILQAFSENRRPTIIARDSRFQEVMGNREGFSFLDLKIINLMYDCAEGTENRAKTL